MASQTKQSSTVPAAKGTLAAGSPAPTFSLRNQNGEMVSLKDLAGQWTILYCYPKDDTPGCTKEAQEFTAALDSFRRLGARVLGISPDSPESHQRFIQTYSLSVDLLSDPSHEVLAKYGAWGEKSRNGRKSQGVLRSTVLIDPQGKIACHWPNVTPAGHAAEVRQKLTELAGS